MSRRVTVRTCNRVMPRGEVCARTPSHGGWCRSGYAMGNARVQARLAYVPVQR